MRAKKREVRRQGIVRLVGAGPGDPDLLTLRAVNCLHACDLVVYDALIPPEILERIPPDKKRVLMGRRAGGVRAEQSDVNRFLYRAARAGLDVVRLKGGDPYVFGRGGEEALFLRERGVAVEVVPGITAAPAAGACAGVPLTHRDAASATVLVTGRESADKADGSLDWAALSRCGTLCVYMAVQNLDAVVKELKKHLKTATPALVVSRGTTARQRSVRGTLRDIVAKVRQAAPAAPALLIVGETVRWSATLNFFERRSLFGRTLVVTRASMRSEPLTERLRAAGAQVIPYPVIRIRPPRNLRPLRQAVARLATFDWLAFSSARGVEAFGDALQKAGKDARALGRIKIAAVGSAAADRLREFGLVADLVPDEFVGEKLAEALVAEIKRTGGKKAPRVLWVRAKDARPEFARLVRAGGAQVEEVVAYETKPEIRDETHRRAESALLAGVADAVVFTSGSTVRHFVRLFGAKRLRRAQSSRRLGFYSIGPITSQTMRELKLPVAAEAARHDLNGLAELLLRRLGRKNRRKRDDALPTSPDKESR